MKRVISEKAYSEETLKKRSDDTMRHKEFVRQFGLAAHIKERYVAYIANTFIKTLRRIILEQINVKIRGLGEFYFTYMNLEEDPYLRKEPKLYWNHYYQRYLCEGVKPELKFCPSKDFIYCINNMLKEKNMYVVESVLFTEDQANPPSVDYMNKIMGMNLKIRAYQEKNGLLPKPFKMKTDEEVIRLYKEIFGEEDFKDGKADN